MKGFFEDADAADNIDKGVDDPKPAGETDKVIILILNYFDIYIIYLKSEKMIDILLLHYWSMTVMILKCHFPF